MNSVGTRIHKYDSLQEMIEMVNRRGIAETLYLASSDRQEILADVLGFEDWHVGEDQFLCKDGSVIAFMSTKRPAPSWL